MLNIEVRFWDGEKNYEGNARELGETYVVAKIRVTKSGDDETLIPVPEIVEEIIAHLKGRIVPMEIGKGEIKADVLAKLDNVEADPEDPRRVILMASFDAKGARERSALGNLIKETRRIKKKTKKREFPK